MGCGIRQLRGRWGGGGAFDYLGDGPLSSERVTADQGTGPPGGTMVVSAPPSCRSWVPFFLPCPGGHNFMTHNT